MYFRYNEDLFKNTEDINLTAEEALSYLQTYELCQRMYPCELYCGTCPYNVDIRLVTASFRLACEALRNTIDFEDDSSYRTPMKISYDPHKAMGDAYTVGRCPRCGCGLINLDNYCRWCGQALKWFEMKDGDPNERNKS